MRVHGTIRLAFWVQTACIIVLVLVTAWLAITAAQTQQALCTFRADLDRRHKDGLAFLVANPNGIPGVSRADIQRSLNAQEATLDALESLDCDGGFP